MAKFSNRPTDPVRFKLLEVESEGYEVYRKRVRLNRRLLPIRTAALVVYLLAQNDDAITIHARGKPKVWRTGKEFKENEFELMKYSGLDAGIRLPKWVEILGELGLLG